MEINKLNEIQILNIHNQFDKSHFDSGKKYIPIIMSLESATKVKTTVLEHLSKLYNFDLNTINDNRNHLFILSNSDHNVIAIIANKYTSPEGLNLCNYSLFSIGYQEKTWSDMFSEGLGVLKSMIWAPPGAPPGALPESNEGTINSNFLEGSDIDTHIIKQLVSYGYIKEVDGVFYSH